MRKLPFKSEIFGPIWKVSIWATIKATSHPKPIMIKAGYICHFSSHRVDVVMWWMGIRTRGVGHWSKYRIENRGVAGLPVIIHRLSHSWDSVGKLGALSFGFGHRPPVPFTLTSVSSPCLRNLCHISVSASVSCLIEQLQICARTLFRRSSVWSLPLLWHTVVNISVSSFVPVTSFTQSWFWEVLRVMMAAT